MDQYTNKLHFKENHSSSYTIFRHGALKHDWSGHWTVPSESVAILLEKFPQIYTSFPANSLKCKI